MVAGLLVEDLAEGLLVRLGYVIKERRKKIVFEGVEVAEIDYLAEKEGEKYIVEVKAGRISVNDVRQVYTNSVLVNARP
ncbi:MAG TPA: endonuclease, partial [Thermofilum sp.]|nr:endonuclease [Thermofilum sp.]